MGIVRSAVIDAYDIMSCDKILFTKEALDAFIARLA
jgi:ribosomal protein L4